MNASRQFTVQGVNLSKLKDMVDVVAEGPHDQELSFFTERKTAPRAGDTLRVTIAWKDDE